MIKRVPAMMTVLLLLALTAYPAKAQEEEFQPDAAAAKALNELAQACRSRPAHKVKATLKIKITQNETTSEGEKVEAEFLHVKGGEGTLKIRDFTCYVNGGEFFAVHKDVDHSYFSEPLDGAAYWIFFDAFRDLPYPHLALFWGDPEPEFLWWELHSGTPEIVPVAVENVEIADPKDETAKLKRRRITLKGADGSMVIRFDPKTRLIDHIQHRITGGEFVQQGAIQTTEYIFEHKVYKELPDEKIYKFAPGERQRVAMLSTLIPQPEPPAPAPMEARNEPTLVGKAAPAFTLATADGGAIDLEELRGKVVVLDFWATWCRPCRDALPHIHDVARWADGMDLPVKVVTVNVWEKADGPEAKNAAVLQFWRANKFTLPVAMDYTNETASAYGVSGIPTTVIIRSDGVVHASHSGFGGVELLKQEISAALDALESNVEAPSGEGVRGGEGREGAGKASGS